MRAVAVSYLVLLSIGGCTAQTSPATPREPTSGKLYQFNEAQVDACLSELAAKEPDVARRAAILARSNIGQPYKLGLLGEAPFELYDPDPLYCLSASDCVTFVEQTFAMAMSHDWPTFFQNLQRIRYKDGRIGMLTRNHFTEADWNVNNAWVFDDVTAKLGAQTRPLRITIDRAAFFAKFKIGQGIPVQHFETVFVPRDQLSKAEGQLRDADIIEIVRGTEKAPYIGHLGIILHDEHGHVTMIHSGKPAVHESDLEGYVRDHANIIGFKFLRMRPSTGGAGATR